MAFISKKKISSTLKRKLNSTAGYRERTLMNSSNIVYTGNKGRTLTFKNTRTGNFCMYDKKNDLWVG